MNYYIFEKILYYNVELCGRLPNWVFTQVLKNKTCKLYIVQECLVLFYIFSSLLIFQFCSCIIFLSLLSTFMIVTLNFLNYQIIHILSFLQGQFLNIYFIPLIRPCFLVSSCALSLCFGICTFERIATSTSFYGLALYRERPWLISTVWDSASLLNLSCWCIFSGLVPVNAHVEGFAGFLFQELIISCSLLCLHEVLQVLWSCYRPPSSLSFSTASRLPEYLGYYQCTKSGKTETSSSGSPPEKLECWSGAPLFFFGGFLPLTLYWAGERNYEACVLVQIVAFVVSYPNLTPFPVST